MTMVPNLRQEQADKDAQKAREIVEDAMDHMSQAYRVHGTDRLLAAAQVYATLATRA